MPLTAEDVPKTMQRMIAAGREVSSDQTFELCRLLFQPPTSLSLGETSPLILFEFHLLFLLRSAFDRKRIGDEHE